MSRFFIRLSDRKVVLALLLTLSLIFYLPVYGSGFVTDFLGWLNCFENRSLAGAHNCFGVQGLYYVPFAILYGMTSLFGTHPLPWYLLFAGLHGVNAYLLYRLMDRLGQFFSTDIPKSALLIGCILFIVFPYNVEVVAWKACSNYLSALLLFLLTVDRYIVFLKNGSRTAYLTSVVLFAVSLFNIEFALMLPVVLLLMHLFAHHLSWNRIQTTLPYFAIVGLSLLINQVTFERPVGHYEIEPGMLDPIILAGTELKYLVKNVFLFRFVPYSWQDTVYAVMSKPAMGWSFMIFLIATAGFVLVRLKHLSNRVRFSLFLLTCYVLLILPVAHLYFYFLQLSENDRYSYLALAFLLPLISLTLYSLGKPGKILLVLYTLFSVALGIYMNMEWSYSTAMHDHLVETFPNSQRPTFMLNVPENYNGIFMFRNIGAESAFTEAMDHFGEAPSGRIVDVLQYNANRISDGVNVSRVSPDTIKVEFNQWGNWWWRNGVGASNYSTEEFRVRPAVKYYYFVVRDLPEGSRLLYYDGSHWAEFED